MNRARLAGLLLALLLLLPSATVPNVVLACSCAVETIEDLPADAIVVVGSIGQRAGETRPLIVERWFNGREPVDVLPVAFHEGTGGGDCSMQITAGERVFIVPYRDGAVLRANSCTMQAPVDTHQGTELIAAATERYGPGMAPPGPVDPAGLPESPEQTGDFLAVAAAVAVAVAALFGGLVVLSRRGRRDPA